jgi:hypothetical protein
MEVAHRLAYLYHGSVQNSSIIDIVPLLFGREAPSGTTSGWATGPGGTPKIVARFGRRPLAQILWKFDGYGPSHGSA